MMRRKANTPARSSVLACLLLDLIAVAAVNRAAVGQCELQKLLPTSETESGDFGSCIVVADDLMVIGAPSDRADGIDHIGAIYLFRESNGIWTQEAKIISSDGQQSDYFGSSVDMIDGVIIAGTPSDDDFGQNSGAAYMLQFDETEWVETKMYAPDAQPNHHFGGAVAIDGDTLLVAAHADDDIAYASGAVYVFDYDGSEWVFRQKLIALDGGELYNFGRDVDVEGDVAIIGSHGHDGPIKNAGAAYIFRRDPDTMQWSEEAILFATDSQTFAALGKSVALSGDRAIAGAYGPYSGRPGAAHIFRYDSISGEWSEQAVLTPVAGQEEDYFGWSVALDGDEALIGSRGDDDLGEDSGSAYHYTFDTEEERWKLHSKLLASDGEPEEWFGYGVAIQDGVGFVGARQDDDLGPKVGSAYVFDLPACPHCEADLTGDESVDVLDLLTLLAVWGECPPPPAQCPADIFIDGEVDVLDLLQLLSQWGPC